MAKDTGLAIVLILLLFSYFGRIAYLNFWAIFVLVVTMTWPNVFRLPARMWFGFSHILGGVVSRALLAAAFYLVVTPMGCWRKMAGADAMKAALWKKDVSSVFSRRDHLFRREDLEKPY